MTPSEGCDCDPHGSLHNGECEPRTNEYLGIVAGRWLDGRLGKDNENKNKNKIITGIK